MGSIYLKMFAQSNVKLSHKYQKNDQNIVARGVNVRHLQEMTKRKKLLPSTFD